MGRSFLRRPRLGIAVGFVAIVGCGPRLQPPPVDAGAALADLTSPTDLALVARPAPKPVRVKREPPPKVKIGVRTSPPKADVFWGKKSLGKTPLLFDRPQNSGPVDLVVRLPGYFPVHTRAYTTKGDAISLRLTRLADRQSLFGAKKEAQPPKAEEGAAPSPTGDPAPKE